MIGLLVFLLHDIPEETVILATFLALLKHELDIRIISIQDGKIGIFAVDGCIFPQTPFFSSCYEAAGPYLCHEIMIINGSLEREVAAVDICIGQPILERQRFAELLDRLGNATTPLAAEIFHSLPDQCLALFFTKLLNNKLSHGG